VNLEPHYDLLIVGGGITGAAVLHPRADGDCGAARRRGDFAAAPPRGRRS
jgi:hypothetical protein